MNIKIHSYGAGYPLVFFHGWGFDSQIWRPLVPHLIENYQLILVDLPGFGQSPLMDWGLFKHQLINQLPHHFAVIGWSMGGLYGTRLALEECQRVTHLMNITSSPRFLLDDNWPAVSAEVFEQFHQKLLDSPKATLKEFVELQSAKHPFVLENLPSEEGLKAGLDILAQWDFRKQMTAFDRPACYQFSRLDPIVPIKLMQTMQSLYPNFNYVLFKRAAHMPFLSHTDLFLETIKGFIP